MKTTIRIAVVCIVLGVFALMFKAKDDAPATTVPATTSELVATPTLCTTSSGTTYTCTSFAAPPAVIVPQESAEAQRYRKPCADVKYLAERRPLSDWTQQDLDAVRSCKQMGLY
jgi:hypothetical protein